MKKLCKLCFTLIFLILLLIFIIPFPANAAPPVCGDNVCSGPETCTTCQSDCGACAPVCGDDICNGAETCSSCRRDCGACDGGGATTATATTGGAPSPIKIVFENPKNGDTIKRGINKLIIKGYGGTFLESGIIVSASSELFGNVSLNNNFENREDGIYGANMSIGRNIAEGQYAISAKGEKGTYDEERILVKVDPKIYININTVKKAYFKGERIIIDGNLTYFDKKPLVNHTVGITISSKDFLINKTVKSDFNGIFSDSYLISFAEPDGEWQIAVRAEDKGGNEGKIVFPANVSTPEGTAFYTVTFLSPLKNAEFKRGEIIPITVEIKEEGNPLANATVDFRTPNAEIIKLNEIFPGTYITEYKLLQNDPLGLWNVPVQAVKKTGDVTRAGGNKIRIMIRPATINAALLSPTKANFFAGEKIKIEVKLAYDDGTPIENIKPMVKIGNTTVELSEKKPGIYFGSYLFTNIDTNVNSFELSSTDVYGNLIILPKKAITVRQIGIIELQIRLFYYNVIIQYWYLFSLGLIVVLFYTRMTWHNKYIQIRLDKTIENAKRTLEMEKETQRKYFEHHAITREDYDKLMLKYRERMSDLREKQLKLKKSLIAKREVKIKKLKKKS